MHLFKFEKTTSFIFGGKSNLSKIFFWISDSLNQLGETIQTTKKRHGE